MSLTKNGGPLAEQASGAVDYRVDAPAQLLFFDTFPRRVRAVFRRHDAGRHAARVASARIRALPQLYVPQIE